MLSLIFYESSLLFPYNSILVMIVFISYKLKKLINFHVLFITEKIKKGGTGSPLQISWNCTNFYQKQTAKNVGNQPVWRLL